jgi:hypothetical protein
MPGVKCPIGSELESQYLKAHKIFLETERASEEPNATVVTEKRMNQALRALNEHDRGCPSCRRARSCPPPLYLERRM